MTLAVIRPGKHPVIRPGENTGEAARQAVRAAGFADAAAASEAVALAAAGPNYANTAAGLADTSEGDTFAVEDDGIVTVYRHDSGPTATELRVLPTTAALASTDADKGGSMVVTRAGGTLADAAALAISADGGADISSRLTAAIALANGKRIVIPPGAWTAKNVDVTGATLEFAAGATVTMTLGAEDNGFTSDGGTTLIRPVFVVANSGSPADGGVGNIITMGSYATDGTVYAGLEIIDGTFTCNNSGLFGLAISCLGRCEGVRLRGTTKLRGRFAGGFQAHWGGEFDGDPHSAEVTASHHPNDIIIEKLVLEKGGQSTLGGHLGLSLSGAYNVQVGTIVNKGWDRTDWIQPGDVYDLVAGEDQADKIMSGIRIGYTEVINPVQNTSGYNNVLVSGFSATVRTAGQTEQVCAADRQNMRVDHGEIRFVCEAGHTYNTDPLLRMIYAKDSKAAVSFEGFAANSSSLAQSVQSTDCHLSVAGTGVARALIAHSNIRNTYSVEWDTLTAAASISTSHRVVALGTAAGTATVDDAVTAGDTAITISAWSGQAASLAIKGTRLYLSDTQYVTLSRSQTIGTGVTSIDIDPAPFAISASATLSLTGRELDSEIRGKIERGYAAIELMNTDGVRVPANCYRSARNDVYLSGATNRRALFNGVYDRCGQIASGSSYNINMPAGVLSFGLTARGARFEQSGTALVSSNIYARATNNAVPGLKVTDCDLNSTSHPVNYLWPTDEATLDAGPPQVFGNRRHAAMATTQYDFDINQGATMQVGAAYHIWRTSAPGSGHWPTTSRWFNPAAASGVSPGSIRSAAGAWVAEPVL